MLRDFPAEVLALVTGFLNAEHISHLWGCGNVLLNQKMALQGGLRVFSMVWNSSAAFAPPQTMILSLRYLTELKLSFGEFNSGRSFGDISSLMLKLPVTLQKLTLSSYDALSCLTNVNNAAFVGRTQKYSLTAPMRPAPLAIDMKSLFPSLEHLDLTSQIGLSLSFFDNLPRGLVTLRLNGMVARIAEKDLWSSTTPNHSLPSTSNTSSASHSGTLDMSSQSNPHSSPAESPFPASLKVFETDAIFLFSDESIQRALPDTLERLRIHTTLQDGLFKLLPRGLRFLTLTHVASRSRDVPALVWKDLPPQLEQFWMNRKYFSPKEMADLPRSLTNLMLDTAVSVDDTFVPALPPNLTKLCMGYDIDIDHAWDALPRSLKWIGDGQCKQLPSSKLSLLPPALTRFDHTHALLGPDEMEVLPRSIRELRIMSLNDDNAPHLPPLLERLSVHSETCSPLGVSQWPRSIRSLQLNGASMQESACVANLPPVTQLSFLRRPDSSLDKQALRLLPKSITNLSFYACGELQMDEWLMELPDTLPLKVLDSLASSATTSRVFAHLPKSIRSLSIRLKAEPFDAKRLSDLPQGLQSLKIQSDSDQDWIDTQLALLPRGLFCLELPNCPAITLETLAHLPKWLDTFSLAESIPFWWAKQRKRL